MHTLPRSIRNYSGPKIIAQQGPFRLCSVPRNLRMPTNEDLQTAFEQGEAALMALCHEGATQVTALAQPLAKQGAVRQAVQARLTKTSRTSSTPPSSAGAGKVKRTASLRKSGDQPHGDQPGHDGQPLMAAEPPARPRTHEGPRGAHGQASLQAGEVVGDAARQGVDRPAIRSEVTAHRAQIKVCPACGRANKGPFPAAVPPAVPYGPTVNPWASYFPHQPHIPVARTPERCADWGPHRVSEAPGLKASEHVERGMAPATAAVKGLLRKAEVLQVDASGRRVTGQLPWLQVACTERLTSYEVHAKRGHAALEDAGLLGAFRGIAGHAQGQPYLQANEGEHAWCQAPHLRERRFIDTP
jgi:transposase